MRYVSDIVGADGKSLDTSRFTMWVSVDELSISVLDTDDGSIRLHRDVDAFDCYGLSSPNYDSSGYAVKHNQKTVSLYRYVKSARTILGTREVPADGIDRCVITNGHYDISGVVGKSVIVVNMVNDSVTFLGKSGSVAVRQKGFLGDVQLYTLYDLLGLLCREAHLNLMLYSRIYLFSKRNNYTSVLELSQDSDAKRYFLKMYMDVVKS